MHQNPRRLARLLAVATAALAGVGLAVAAAAPAVAAPAVAGVTVSAPTAATAGDTVTVTVTLAGAADVYGFEAVLAFDPAVVSYVDGSAVAPAGGFDSVRAGSGTVDLVHTRLGTSPALSGDIAYSLTFTATAAGSTAFAVRSVALVDASSAVTPLTNPAASAALVVAPAAVASPSPTPTPPASTGGEGSGSGTAGDGTDAAATSAGDLASTGSNAAPFVVVALVLLAAGAAAVLLAVRRRHAGDAR